MMPVVADLPLTQFRGVVQVALELECPELKT